MTEIYPKIGSLPIDDTISKMILRSIPTCPNCGGKTSAFGDICVKCVRDAIITDEMVEKIMESKPSTPNL